MLRLQIYPIGVVYIPVSQMFSEGHLSRAFLKDTGPDDGKCPVFIIELEAMSPLSTIKINSEWFPQVQQATDQSPLLVGWPGCKEEVPICN